VELPAGPDATEWMRPPNPWELPYALDAYAGTTGRTQLELAAASGSISLIRAVVRGGAEINHESKAGMTPLIWASQAGNSKGVGELLTLGADVR